MLRKATEILNELFVCDEVKANDLRSAFCSEMANVIVSLKDNEKVLGKPLNDAFLEDVKNGEYHRAFQVFKYLDAVEI